ncbi:MAG: transcription antitermination factor NusB [Candidatus Devosia symbiotica]|nr:transcription antitermination factor NusB [Candidatus Devosia symbiotica]
MVDTPKCDPQAERPANQRGAARLAAVQALYQMDIGRTSLEDTLAQFGSFHLGREIEGEQYLPADADFFRQIVSGVTKHQLAIDPAVDRALAKGWQVERVDATLRAILRAAAFELLRRKDIPTRVVITEYIDIAKAFYEDKAAGLVNGTLDAIAREASSDTTETKYGRCLIGA